ncbi:MAG: hypothetical protein DRJ10_06225, partial [Bacteroidetes bacterium]
MKKLIAFHLIFIFLFSIFNSIFAQDMFQFTPVKNGDVAWGDYDNDGNLDLLLAGESAEGKVTKIYRNNGDETFTEQTGIVLSGFYKCAVAWSDYNNDGDLDFYISGNTDIGSLITLYKNNGNNSFTALSIDFSVNHPGSVIKCFDFNNDGFEDVLFGSTTNNSKLYKNNGDETFTMQEEFEVAQGKNGIDIGDYNNDGWIDVLSNGIFKNNGGTFTKENINFGGTPFLFIDYNIDNF